jgi:hypothetical protein
VIFIRDRTLRRELDTLAAELALLHPGSGITATTLAHELLWHAVRDPRLRAKLPK